MPSDENKKLTNNGFYGIAHGLRLGISHKTINYKKGHLTMFGKQRLITIAMTLATLAVINKVAVLAPAKKIVNG